MNNYTLSKCDGGANISVVRGNTLFLYENSRKRRILRDRMLYVHPDRAHQEAEKWVKKQP